MVTGTKIGTRAEATVISTGNGEIDKKMGGGIPVGSLTLIEGHSSAGKSVLTQQMMWGSLNQGLKVTLFTTENTMKSLLSQMASLAQDVTDYFLLGRLRILPVKAMKAGERPDAALRLLLRVMNMENGVDVVMMDSLTSFIAYAPEKDAISFYEECKSYCNEGKTVTTVVHSYAFSEATLARISSMCDAHLRLCLDTVGTQLVKTMEVAKVRGAARTTGNIITFDVEPGWGMRIIPFSRAKA